MVWNLSKDPRLTIWLPPQLSRPLPEPSCVRCSVRELWDGQIRQNLMGEERGDGERWGNLKLAFLCWKRVGKYWQNLHFFPGKINDSRVFVPGVRKNETFLFWNPLGKAWNHVNKEQQKVGSSKSKPSCDHSLNSIRTPENKHLKRWHFKRKIFQPLSFTEQYEIVLKIH